MIARYEVKGHSMEPAYREGDRLLLWKTKNVKKGDVIIFSRNKMDCIKRVNAINGDFFFVEGDNNSHSTDSREYGEIKKKQIIGKVILKYREV